MACAFSVSALHYSAYGKLILQLEFDNTLAKADGLSIFIISTLLVQIRAGQLRDVRGAALRAKWLTCLQLATNLNGTSGVVAGLVRFGRRDCVFTFAFLRGSVAVRSLCVVRIWSADDSGRRS